MGDVIGPRVEGTLKVDGGRRLGFAEFGVPDRRSGTATRGGREIPRSAVIEGYGKVYFFTKNKGRWRSGTVVITEGLGGPLGGHEIRYMHLAAVKPGLKVGDVLEMGDELGLLGGTGVQQSAPHLHLDIQDPDGQRVDVAPLLGLPPTAADCAGTVVAAARATVYMRTPGPLSMDALLK